jgi:hypothetical protein
MTIKKDLLKEDAESGLSISYIMSAARSIFLFAG